MYIPNHKRKALPAILLLLLMVMTLLPVSAFAAELPSTATIAVEKKLSGETPPNAETSTFTLAPDDASYPMPEGENADTVSIQGAGTACFGAITYVEPNTYTYTLQETPGDTANFTYDKTIYKVTVYVTTDDAGELTSKVCVTADGTDTKSAVAVFTNSYKRPPVPDHPQTGETANLPLWIALGVCSVAALLMLLFSMKSKKNAE